MLGPMGDLGRALVLIGGLLILFGAGLLLLPRLPWVGRMPGDLVVHREHFTFYFPVVTSIVVSVVLSLLLNLFWRR